MQGLEVDFGHVMNIIVTFPRCVDYRYKDLIGLLMVGDVLVDMAKC